MRPEYVDIGPHRFAIHWDEASINREQVREQQACDGHIRYSQTRICIDPEGVLSHQREVLFHEIIHGVLSVTGGNHFPRKASVDDILTRFDAMLLDTLQRNPHVTAWLCATESAP